MSVQNRVYHHCIRLFDVFSFPISSHPCLFVVWLFPTLLSSLFLSLCLAVFLYLHSSLQPPTPLVFTSMPPPPAYFSVDGALSRPWLTLVQPPPPLCSLWWWGSLCCDTDAGSADRATDWNTDSPESQTLGKDRGQTDRRSVSKDYCALFFFMYILFEKVIVLKWFLCLEVVCAALTQQHWQRGTERMRRRFTAAMLWACEALGRLAHCAPVFLSWQKPQLDESSARDSVAAVKIWHFGHTKSPDHQTALLIHILFTPFEDTTITTTFSVILQSTCRKNDLTEMYNSSTFSHLLCCWGFFC